jgi:hypothetical protein
MRQRRMQTRFTAQGRPTMSCDSDRTRPDLRNFLAEPPRWASHDAPGFPDELLAQSRRHIPLPAQATNRSQRRGPRRPEPRRAINAPVGRTTLASPTSATRNRRARPGHTLRSPHDARRAHTTPPRTTRTTPGGPTRRRPARRARRPAGPHDAAPHDAHGPGAPREPARHPGHGANRAVAAR